MLLLTVATDEPSLNTYHLKGREGIYSDDALLISF